jgi:hypothetical protein
MNMVKKRLVQHLPIYWLGCLIFVFVVSTSDAMFQSIEWTHLTSKNGGLPAPNGGLEQTATLILDVDRDGVNDFVIAERSQAPAVVWYRRNQTNWTKYIIDSAMVPVEAGGAFYDIDGDGDLDIVFGGYPSNQVWWWENPYPNYQPNTPWTRRLIKNSGGLDSHDQIFGDFNGDGKTELVLWDQGVQTLFIASIPDDPRNATSWPLTAIYTYSGTKHEGLAKIDVDGDGIEDIVGGGRWFKYNGGTSYTANIIDSGQTFTRAAAGQLKAGGRPEVVFVSGDGVGPLEWYEWNGSSWTGHDLLGFDVDHGHSLQVADINGDGSLDIFCAEMRLDGGNPDAKMWIFYGDGQGHFTLSEVASGYGNHESKVGDLDGDGDLDILGKPFNWDTPRVDVWLNGLLAAFANVKVFLQGPYTEGGDSMTTDLHGLIPAQQPYGGAPWNYAGTESVTSIPDYIVDWVLMELRTATDTASKVATRAAFLRSNGAIVDLNGNSPVSFTSVPSGNYYVVVRHRNHLAIMSALPVSLSQSTGLYDFTTAQTKAYGTLPMISMATGAYAMCAGDGNASGIVTAADANSVFGALNVVGYHLNDINLSGIVTAADVNVIFRNLNKATHVP